MNNRFRTLAVVALFAASTALVSTAQASSVRLQGPVTWSCVSGVGVITVNDVSNYELYGYSGTLFLELWAFPSPYAGSLSFGYKIAEYSLGQLNAGWHIPGINTGHIPCLPPPNGTWYVTVGLTEYTGVSYDNGYEMRDYINTMPPWVVGTLPPPPPLTIENGLWWNPAESGTGYTIAVHNGVLVAVIYSYKANGEGQWYLSAGALTNGNRNFTGTLDKYVGGQCISCAWSREPSSSGNDGAVTITFTSGNSAMLTLPGGRVTAIQPMQF